MPNAKDKRCWLPKRRRVERSHRLLPWMLAKKCQNLRSRLSGPSLDARVQFLEARVQFKFQSFPSTEGTEGLALTPCSTIWSPPLPALPPLQWYSSSVSRSRRLLPRISPGAFANAVHVQTPKTWFLKIWHPPFFSFQAPHFPSTFVGGSSLCWSRGRARPPPCAAGNGPDQSDPPTHPG